jgi:hypothetical protein
MMDWLSTACCLYGARLKNEHAHLEPLALKKKSRQL